jgi:sarcosine oxidase / L-pipecolate oxidase
LITYRSGVLVLGLQTSEESQQNTAYTDAGLKNDIEAGARIQILPSSAEIRRVIPDGVKTGPIFENCRGYLNEDGGWAAAFNAMNTLLQNVKILGGNVMTGAKMTGLQFDKVDENKVCGIVLEDGTSLSADIVILAAGAWSTSITGLPRSVNAKLAECLTANG